MACLDHDVDFYLHAWTPAPQLDLIHFYEPEKLKILKPLKLSKAVTKMMVALPPHNIGPKNHNRAVDMFSQWRGVEAAWQLVEGQYDAVIRLRYDILFRGSISRFLVDLRSNECRVPYWRDASNGINDHFAILGPDAAKIYCGGMKKFLRDRLPKSRLVYPFHFTQNLAEHLSRESVEVSEFALPYLLVRPEHEELLTYGEIQKRQFEQNEGATFKRLVIRNHEQEPPPCTESSSDSMPDKL